MKTIAQPSPDATPGKKLAKIRKLYRCEIPATPAVPEPAPIHVTLYQGAKKPEPEWQDCMAWDELVESMRDVIGLEAREKTRLLALGPHRLTVPYRKEENVAAVTLLVIDLDRCDLPALATRIGELDVAAILYGSPSDDPAKSERRVRVVAPVTREIRPDECAATRKAFAELLGLTPGQGVEGAIDPARLFFIGRIEGTPERLFEAIEGHPVDVDALLAQPLECDWGTPAVPGTTRSSVSTSRVGRVAAVVLPLVVEKGQRHDMARALGGWLARFELGAWSDGEISAVVRALPSDDREARVRDALESAARARREEAAPGWEYLSVALGEDAPRLEQAARSEWWVRACAPGGVWERLAANDTAATDASHDPERGVPATDRAPDPADERRSDLGNARRLVRLHGDRLRYFRARRTWYVWDDTRWRADDTGEIERAAKYTAESLWDEALAEDDDRRKAAIQWAARSQDRARIANMIELAGSEPGIPVTAAMLDSDPWLLNVTNGTLDLRTGELREPDPGLLMTKCCATCYDPEAQSDLWEAFVRRTTGGDAELAAYIQRALGYALVGAWYEKAFWFGYGPPDGAKSTMLGVVGDVLGDYHVAAAASTWMVQSSQGGNRGDVTRLLGARLVTSLEIRPGLRFDEELVKKVTGGDRLTFAAKYEAEIEFPPTFALWMGANDRPTIRDDDEGMWSRVRCVPFTNPVPKVEQDRHLRETLTSPEHAPAVLRWLVDGCVAWQRSGLGDCAAVASATTAYRASMNQAAGFVEARLAVTGDPADAVPSRAMRVAYEKWCEANSVRRPLDAKGLGQRLRALGVQGGDDSTKRETRPATGNIPAQKDRHWLGVRLSADD
jgi:P4 family phage/plasmid primase-like protien